MAGPGAPQGRSDGNGDRVGEGGGAAGPRRPADSSRRLQTAHMLRGRSPPRARRPAPTPRPRLSDAASHLDLSETPSRARACCRPALTGPDGRPLVLLFFFFVFLFFVFFFLLARVERVALGTDLDVDLR